MYNTVRKEIETKCSYALVLMILFSSLISHKAYGQRTSITPDSRLASTDTFSFGLVGFVGKISDGESAYHQILRSANASSRFLAIYEAESSSLEGKLYAACGLKKLSNNKFNHIREELSVSKKRATTMKGDVMLKESVSEIIQKIDKFSCE